jgi:hypothetical protein
MQRRFSIWMLLRAKPKGPNERAFCRGCLWAWFNAALVLWILLVGRSLKDVKHSSYTLTALHEVGILSSIQPRVIKHECHQSHAC